MGIESGNTKEIGDEEKIKEAVKDVLSKDSYKGFSFALTENPVSSIQEAINLVCDAYGWYSTIPSLN